jgi:excinuclease UvrABC nuclease subunit
MDWDDLTQFSLSRTNVARHAPEESGVYGLLVPGKWIYIGHSFNIRKALLEYLSGQMPYVLQWQPRQFTFELLPYKDRLARQKELVARYQPVCNRKSQSLVRS